MGVLNATTNKTVAEYLSVKHTEYVVDMAVEFLDWYAIRTFYDDMIRQSFYRWGIFICRAQNIIYGIYHISL